MYMALYSVQTTWLDSAKISWRETKDIEVSTCINGHQASWQFQRTSPEVFRERANTMETIQKDLVQDNLLCKMIRQAQEIRRGCTGGWRGIIVKQCRLLKLQIDSLYRLTTPIFNMDVNEDWVTAYPSLTM